MTTFDRALKTPFVDALRREAENDGWWRNVLQDRDLVLAVRGTYLNVYRNGLALFTVSRPNDELRVTTHEKFLLDPELKGQVILGSDGSFAIDERALIKRYEGPTTLAKLKAASSHFAGEEKIGCHKIAVSSSNPGVVDVEITFPGKHSLPNGRNRIAPRVDLAAFEQDGSDAQLVFWEAKTYANGDLRVVADEPAPVCEQVEDYRTILARNAGALEDSYTKVASNLVAFSEMGWVRKLSPLIEAGATDRAKLRLGENPKVGLLVFGFDVGQRDEPRWQVHHAKLQKQISEVRILGDAAQIKL